MSKVQSELLKKLSKYPKEDIIEALGRQFQADYIISRIVYELEEQETQKVFKDHEKAFDDLISAHNAYKEWKKEMCVKYGDGKTVKLSAIPPEEITHGATLEKAINKATETEQRLSKKIDKLLKTED